MRFIDKNSVGTVWFYGSKMGTVWGPSRLMTVVTMDGDAAMFSMMRDESWIVVNI